MIYELWNTRTRNLVDSFSTEAAALSAARKIIEANGPDYARHLALAQEDSRGKTRFIASGTDLVVHIDRAKAADRSSQKDSRRSRRTRRVSDRSAETRAAVHADDGNIRPRFMEESEAGYLSNASLVEGSDDKSGDKTSIDD